MNAWDSGEIAPRVHQIDDRFYLTVVVPRSYLNTLTEDEYTGMVSEAAIMLRGAFWAIHEDKVTLPPVMELSVQESDEDYDFLSQDDSLKYQFVLRVPKEALVAMDDRILEDIVKARQRTFGENLLKSLTDKRNELVSGVGR